MLSVHSVSSSAVAIGCCDLFTWSLFSVLPTQTNSCHGTTHRLYTHTRQNKNAWCEFAQT